MKQSDETERQITVNTPNGTRVFSVYISEVKAHGVAYVTFGPDRRTCMVVGLIGGPMFMTSDPIMLNSIRNVFKNYCLIDLCERSGGTDGEKKESERGSEPPTVP